MTLPLSDSDVVDAPGWRICASMLAGGHCYQSDPTHAFSWCVVTRARVAFVSLPGATSSADSARLSFIQVFADAVRTLVTEPEEGYGLRVAPSALTGARLCIHTHALSGAAAHFTLVQLRSSEQRRGGGPTRP